MRAIVTIGTVDDQKLANLRAVSDSGKFPSIKVYMVLDSYYVDGPEKEVRACLKEAGLPEPKPQTAESPPKRGYWFKRCRRDFGRY